MNERIKQLAEQAGFTANDPDKVFLRVYEQELAKFVELIIQECTVILRIEEARLDAIPGREIGAQTMEAAQALIQKHFGFAQ